MPTYTDLMIDLETAGKVPGCVVATMALVPFNLDTGQIAPFESCFYTLINRPLQLDSGVFHEDPETLEWWADQNEVARAEFDAANAPGVGVTMEDALRMGHAYAWDNVGPDGRTWSNGASFDIPILDFAAHALDCKVPWGHQNTRCMRTLKNLYPDVPKPEDAGPGHHALFDALWQASYTVRMMQVHTARQAMALRP